MQNDLSHHLYADDTQIYLSISAENGKSSLDRLDSALSDVSSWMLSNKLKLNEDKTEFMMIGTAFKRNKLSTLFPTNILDHDLSPSRVARNLGVIFDEDFTFRQHVINTCRACYYHIRDLRRIRKHLTLSTAKIIANALVSSRIDYCNSLLYGIAAKDIGRLQRVQNCLSRVVLGAPRFSSTTPLLKKLHWLPVESRIRFKVSTLTYKTLALEQPVYLNDLLIPAAKGVRALRSGTTRKLSVPRVKTKVGTRGFSSAAPHLWNALPANIREARTLMTFRRLLKTHLFGLAFAD